jgi:hypothetical protein
LRFQWISCFFCLLSCDSHFSILFFSWILSLPSSVLVLMFMWMSECSSFGSRCVVSSSRFHCCWHRSSAPVKPACHSDFPLCVILSTAAGVPFQFTVSCSHGFLASRPLDFPGWIHFQAQRLVLLADFPRRFLLKPVLATSVSGSALQRI